MFQTWSEEGVATHPTVYIFCFRNLGGDPGHPASLSRILDSFQNLGLLFQSNVKFD